MRIAYLNTNGIPARYGGSETAVEEIGTRLVRRGHEVTVYCNSESGPRYSWYRGVRLINMSHFIRHPSKFVDYPLRCLLSTFDAMLREFQVLHYFAQDSAIFTLAPRALLKKIVITVDGVNWNRASYPKWARLLVRESMRWALYLPHVTTVDSAHMEELLRKTWGKAPIYVPYGAKVSPRGADRHVPQRYDVEEDRYVLFVGRLVLEKGVHNLIRAFNQSGIQSEFQLVIVGGDRYSLAYELALRKMAKKNVKFLGYVYGADMENLCKGAYLYVSASEMEGTSPALLSAMGFGNCVLVSDIPENLETIGDAGVTFKNRDWQDLRDKMLYLISNSDVVREYRKRAAERIARLYSWDSVAERMERLYLSLT